MLPLILIVDDKEEIARIIAMYLRSVYRTQHCNDGKMALQWLAQTDELPNLIISDVRMPDMDGYELLRNLKSDSRLEALPVIILSSIESSADRIRLLEMGAVDFIVKPFNPEELRLRIWHILKT